VTTPLTEQIRDYFADIESQQGAIDIDALMDRDRSQLATIEEARTPPPATRDRWRVGLAAAAAVVALIVGLIVVRSVDDRSPVDDVVPTIDDTIPVTTDDPPTSVSTTQAPQPTTTSTPPTSLAPVGSLVAGFGCPFGITGDSIVMERGPADPINASPAEPGQNIAHASIGSLTAEVRVPGRYLADTPSTEIEAMEDIELARGPAKIWSPANYVDFPFVQVVGFSDLESFLGAGSETPCSSFTVTVEGGTQDENRQLAIDLAQLIQLPSELGNPDLPGAEGGPVAGLELANTKWNMPPGTWGVMPPWVISFGDTTVTWNDGCATIRADYDLDRERGILLLTNRSSTNPGCTPPPNAEGENRPWLDLRAVMNSERIDAEYVLEFPGGNVNEAKEILRLGTLPGPLIILTQA
jgi:hypothetical protein